MAKVIASVCLITGVLVLFVGYKLLYPPHYLSPIGTTSPLLSSSTSKSHLVYGFLPYWVIKEDLEFSPHLTHLAYFAVEPNTDGSFKTRETKQESHLGWRWLHQDRTATILEKARQQGISAELVVTLFDNQIIESIATNSAVQTRLTQNLIDLAIEHQFTGINLDYEPSSTLPHITKQFTNFLKTLRQATLANSPPLKLSLDVYARTAKEGQNSPLADWHPYVDYIIIMAYDYHQTSSPNAGPIAPLYSPNPNANAIVKNLHQFQQIVPLDKVILGLSLYGYQWTTVDDTFQSLTFPKSGKTIYYYQLSETLNHPQTTLFWNSLSQTPWSTTKTEDEFIQIYYDNPHSYQQKISLVTNTSLAGISLWAIGYGETDPEIQTVLKGLNP